MSSSNPFEILSDDSLVEDLEKLKIASSKKQPLLFGSITPRKNNRHKGAPFELIYDIEYLWFLVLEFLPLKDLFQCSQLDKFTHSLVHSFNCYAEILKRDFLSKHMYSKGVCTIIKNLDNTGLYAFILKDFFVKTTKIPLQKQQQLKLIMTQVPDARSTKVFRNIYSAVENEIENQKNESEMLRQHVRRFLIEKMGKVKLDGMKSKVRECSHNHCEMVVTNHLAYTRRLECLDCKLVAFTNFDPSTIFIKEKTARMRFCRNTKDMYILGVNHVYEFEKSTVRC